MIELLSSKGYPRVKAQAERRALDTPAGKRVGFIWNQYSVTHNFWPRLERALEKITEAPSVRRAYKTNTWTPQEQPKFDALAAEVDYLVVDVGA